MKKLFIILFILVSLTSYLLGWERGYKKAEGSLIPTGRFWKEQCEFTGGSWMVGYEWGDKIRFSCLWPKF